MRRKTEAEEGGMTGWEEMEQVVVEKEDEEEEGVEDEDVEQEEVEEDR